MKKPNIFKLIFLAIMCGCLSLGFKQTNNIDVTGTWILSKGTLRNLLNNNISFDSLKSNYGANEMVLNFSNGHYQILENTVISDSSTYRVTDNYLFLESGNIYPGYFTIEKITADSLVLYQEMRDFINDDSTFVTKTRLHFYRPQYEY